MGRRLIRHLDLVAVGVGVAVVATAALVKVVSDVAGSCDDDLTLSVAVAPEIEVPVRSAVDSWRTEPPRVDGYCVRVAVNAIDPAAVAVAISKTLGSPLHVDGVVSTVAVPDVWIPDATSWLTRIRAIDRDALRGPAPTVASSPVVLAMPQPLARSHGWPAHQLSWQEILAVATSAERKVTLVEPSHHAVGLSGLLAFGAAARTAASGRGDPDQARLELYSVLARRTVASVTAAVDTFQLRPRDPVVAPLPEWAVLRHNQRTPPVPLAAIYPEPGLPRLDYPMVTMTQKPHLARAAAALRTALTSGTSRAAFAERGFRAPDGTFGAEFPTGPGVTREPVLVTTTPTTDEVADAFTAWLRVSLPVRALVVVNVSTSRRLTATRDALVRVIDRLEDSSDVGLWVFGTRDDEVVPVAPLARNRRPLRDVLGALAPAPHRGPALRETVLSAYATAIAGYVPGRSHVVVYVTDDADEGRLTLPALLTELEKASDPTRPVRVAPVGIGPKVRADELTAIARATGGTAVHVTDLADLTDALLRALRIPT